MIILVILRVSLRGFWLLLTRNLVWLLALKTGVFNIVAVVGVQRELVLFLAQGVEIVLYAEGF